jgi:hypothetical protein
LHGLVKKVGHTYRYYLTLLGKHIIASGLKLKNLVLIPDLALAPARRSKMFCPIWSESLFTGTGNSVSKEIPVRPT